MEHRPEDSICSRAHLVNGKMPVSHAQPWMAMLLDVALRASEAPDQVLLQTEPAYVVFKMAATHTMTRSSKKNGHARFADVEVPRLC
jgi:hypothetical protein